MKKKFLIVVPHQDDELILAGPFMDQIIAIWEVFVIFTTNGDYGLKMRKNYRLEEAIKALSIFGIKKENIIFCGYGDKWKGKHIYNSMPDDLKESSCGMKTTYALESHEDFHYMKYGKHAVYTRRNYLLDLKESVKEIYADIILCVDLDNHPDHIATSLFFEEAIGKIFKECPDYKPIILKRYAYEGSWFGKSDYWYKRKTLYSQKQHKFSKFGFLLNTPSYTFENAIHINTSYNILTDNIKNSKLYKAASEYKTQPLYLRLHRVLNSDSVVWWRSSNNLMFNAKIFVSSGDGKYLNDFKITDCKNVNTNKLSDYMDIGWIPEKNDLSKKVTIVFKNPVQIAEIRLYEIISNNSHIKNCKIVIDKRKVIYSGDFNVVAGCNYIYLQIIIQNVNIVELNICEWTGDSPGLSEIEIFPDIQDVNNVIEQLSFKVPLIHEEKCFFKNLFFSCYYNLNYFFKFKLYFGYRKIINILTMIKNIGAEFKEK